MEYFTNRWSVIPVIGVLMAATSAAEESLTLENVTPLEANRPDEPIRDEFSIDAAVRFLDAVALNWQKERTCFACHSDYAFFFTRPVVSWKAPAHRQLRSKLEHLAEHPRDVEYRATEAVMVASMLAQNDALTTGKLHPTTRKALGRMWTMQREDGGFDWMKYNQPPSEIDDHYGVTMAAIGVGAAPDDYAETPAAKAGLDKIRAYFENNPPAHLHHRAMKLLVLKQANCQDWPEFETIAGAKFWMKPGERDGVQVSGSGVGGGRVKMHIEDSNHPITKGINDFEVEDETYNGQTFGDGIHLLVSTDHPSSDKPIAWVHNYRKARIFGNQSGHDAKVWANKSFQQLMARGIRWTAGRLPATAATENK